jgi:hypothetical protein
MRDPSPIQTPGFALLAAVALATLLPGSPAAQQKSVEELEDVVAPIALYPDDLLRYVLPASTFHEQFAKAQALLEKSDGKPSDDDPEAKALDDSVQALLPFPDIVKMFVEYPDWAVELGDAVALQQADVMDAIQAFRRRVHEAGNLESTKEQEVVVESEVIRIEPADPEVIYVPVYEPTYVVVRQPAPVVYWTSAFWVSSWYWGGYHWGWWGGCHWHGRVTINIHGSHWRPPPHYRPRPPASRPPNRPGGRPPGDRPGRPGGDRPGRPGGDRPSTGQQPALGSRPATGQQPALGSRPATGQQPALGSRPAMGQRPAPAQRPAVGQRPAPSQRPATPRPTFQQSGRPSNSAFGGVSRGSSARQHSSRGHQSMSRSRAGGGASRGGGRRR